MDKKKGRRRETKEWSKEGDVAERKRVKWDVKDCVFIEVGEIDVSGSDELSSRLQVARAELSSAKHS